MRDAKDERFYIDLLIELTQTYLDVWRGVVPAVCKMRVDEIENLMQSIAFFPLLDLAIFDLDDPLGHEWGKDVQRDLWYICYQLFTDPTAYSGLSTLYPTDLAGALLSIFYREKEKQEAEAISQDIRTLRNDGEPQFFDDSWLFDKLLLRDREVDPLFIPVIPMQEMSRATVVEFDGVQCLKIENAHGPHGVIRLNLGDYVEYVEVDDIRIGKSKNGVYAIYYWHNYTVSEPSSTLRQYIVKDSEKVMSFVTNSLRFESL
ncbi:hypothetical protein [Devriesea agamarum]|uniref:hypothetical protein n=1 Tax=Devriesea agamarum TaxID=472569 RepID=UPI0012ED5B16|nr:hypothetical protein [Devriesea agamarum]